MKTRLLTLALLISAGVNAQNLQKGVRVDNSGNYYQVKPEAHDSTTTRTFTDAAGKVWPVYKSAKGLHYVAKVSKAGNYYRKYLTGNTTVMGAAKND